MNSSPIGLDLVWVLPQLAVGGCYPMRAAGELSQRLTIRRVVDVRLECCDDARVLEAHGIALLHLPIEALSPLLQRHLERGVKWVLDGLGQGHKVFIHCEQGMGRSVLLTLCVMVALGWAPLEALEWLKSLRPEISPNPDQLEGFRNWIGEYSRERSPSWTLPALEALSAVAYGDARSEHASP